jgi:hypothetical protein
MAKRRLKRRVNERHTGPKGVRGTAGPLGPRGKIGKPGRKRPKRLTGPLHKDNVLDMVMKHFDDVYQQLNIQMKRIAQIQQQLDLLIAKAGA